MCSNALCDQFGGGESREENAVFGFGDLREFGNLSASDSEEGAQLVERGDDERSVLRQREQGRDVGRVR